MALLVHWLNISSKYCMVEHKRQPFHVNFHPNLMADFESSCKVILHLTLSHIISSHHQPTVYHCQHCIFGCIDGLLWDVLRLMDEFWRRIPKSWLNNFWSKCWRQRRPMSDQLCKKQSIHRSRLKHLPPIYYADRIPAVASGNRWRSKYAMAIH